MELRRFAAQPLLRLERHFAHWRFLRRVTVEEADWRKVVACVDRAVCRASIVNPPGGATILDAMSDFELDQLRRNPAWKAALRYYWDAQTEARASQPTFDGWVPRAAQVPQVEPANLSAVHGRLIAFGFLKFDLSNRELGMRYQLTPLGRQAIGAGEETTEPVELAESA